MVTDQTKRSIGQQRVVRVFVSSTFRDMQEERDLLIKKTFPELRERCRKRRVDFVEVDLRWGVTEEQAERGEVLPVCLAEIENCRPYFIGLLGERYGWVPDHIDPELIETQPWLSKHRKRSLTELEILHGVLKNPEMADHALFYFRDPAYLEQVPADKGKDFESEGPEAREKLTDLKGRIRASGLSVVEDYPDPEALAERVLDDLWELIDSKYPPVEEPDPLDREMADHEAFASSRLGIYIERQEYFERLNTHIQSKEPPLVLIGESGSGKSALVSNWALRYQAKNPSDLLLIHFIGSTAESSDYTRILQRIMGELKRRYNLAGEIPTEAAQLCREFPNWLSMASVKGRFVLVLDGLNQLDERDNASGLGWLPQYFPPNVRVVLSTLPGPGLEALKRRGYPMFRVEPLTREERKGLINDYLWQSRKRLREKRLNRIINFKQTENPLFLRVLLDELKVFGIHERLDERISHYLEAKDTGELYEKVLGRLEEDYEKDRPSLAGEVFSLIWASRMGLSERELLELLNVPRAVWSPLYLAIKDSLTSRSGLLGFFHNYLKEAVGKRYLSAERDRIEAHLCLADYFENLEAKERKVEEFPWHLYQAGDSRRLEGALSDLDLSEAIWEKSKFDLLAFWAFLEESEGIDKELTYKMAVQETERYPEHLFWLSELFYRTGSLDASLKIWQAQAGLYRKSGDRSSLGESLGGQALILYTKGNLDQAMELHKEQERICRELGNKDGLSISLGNQANIHHTKGNLDQAMELHEEQERICRELGNKDGLSISLGNQALIHQDWGNLDQAMELHKEEEQICRELGNKDGLQASLGNQALIHQDWGNLDQAMELHKEQERICRELGNKDSLSASLGGQALILHTKGNLEQAMELHKEEERICRELGNKNGLQTSLGSQALIHKARGNLDQAIELHKEEERICRELGNKNGLQISFGSQALIHHTKGNLEQAMELHKEEERICRELGNKNGLQISFGSQALIHRAWGNLDQAMSLLKKQERICRELGNKDSLQASLGNQANIHHTKGNLDQAMELHKEEERTCRELGNKDSLSISLGNQAVIHQDWGNLDQAMELHKEEEQICRELGNKDGLQASLGNQALIHQDWDDLEQAMEFHKEQERICRELRNPSGLAYSFVNQALVWYEGRHNPKAALPLAKEAFRLFKEVGMKPQAQEVENLLTRLSKE